MKKPYGAPCLQSRPIPVVEQLLATTYGKQAKGWAASSARARR